MFPGSQRCRVILGVVAVELGCLAAGIWIHHHLMVADVWTTAENEAGERLSSEMERMPRAALEGIAHAFARGERDAASLRRQLHWLPAGPEVGWLIADSQWRVLTVLRSLDDEGASPVGREETLAWRQAPAPGRGDSGWMRGSLHAGDHRQAAVARRLPTGSAYLVAHRPLINPTVSAAALFRSLVVDGLVAWLWGGTVVTICVYLIVARFYDALERERLQTETQNLQRMESALRTRDAILHGLASLAESRDEVIGRHLDRVAYYSYRLAVAVRHHPRFRDQVTQEFVELLCPASMLHDLGKVGIEDAILFKPGRFTPKERARMRQHTTLGDKYLAQIEQRLGYAPVIAMARQMALRHHERWDGKGYPDGLSGDQIPLAARIVSLADVYDALRSVRDYKPSFSHEQCLEMIREEAGRQFDPDLAAAFLQLEDCFPRFAVTYAEDPAPRRGSPAAEIDDWSQCTGLVAAMQVIDPEWLAPTSCEVGR